MMRLPMPEDWKRYDGNQVLMWSNYCFIVSKLLGYHVDMQVLDGEEVTSEFDLGTYPSVSKAQGAVFNLCKHLK